MGNVHMLLALAIVLGFRWPATWSFVLLTKVTPGIGLLWFAVRREWRSLGIALGATAALVARLGRPRPRPVARLGALPDPDERAGRAPRRGRCRCGRGSSRPRVLIVWGARTDRRWTVVVGATLALPVLWFHGLAMLAGIVALQRGLPERASTSLDWLRGLRPCVRAVDSTVAASTRAPSVHDQVGGEAFFTRLVDRFYEGVATDPVLLPLYPDAPDLAPARRRLTLFLVQYWGGPGTYSAERGHPRLRMRHAPFADRDARARSLAGPHARRARRGRRRPAGPRRASSSTHYFTMAADAMRNTPD